MDRSATKPLTLGETLGYGAIGLIVFFGVWSLLSFSGAVPRQFLPAPHELAARFFDLLTTPFAGATLPRHLASAYRGARFVGRPLVEAAQMLGTGNLRIIVEVLLRPLPPPSSRAFASPPVSAGSH